MTADNPPRAQTESLGDLSDQTRSKVWILSGVTGSEPTLLSHEAGQVIPSTFNDNDEPVPTYFNQLSGVTEIGSGRKAGKAWKKILPA